MNTLEKIVSGGQTGVDQAALRAAEACGLKLGGWCPPGRISESGQIPERFPLNEAPQDRSPKAIEVARSLRTELNVRDSDATLVLRRLIVSEQAQSDAGTSWTFESAILHGKPLLLCDPIDPDGTKARMICEWLKVHGVKVLNVAGPAESTQPGIGEVVERFLLTVLLKMIAQRDP